MRLAVQLFTLRDQFQADVPGAAHRLAATGCRAVETAGTYGLSAARFGQVLEDAGLQTIACHMGLADIEGRFEETVSEAKELGAQWLVVPWVPEEAYQRGWGGLAARLGEAADRCLAAGVGLAYHNHQFEFQEVDGVPGFSTLWDAAPASLEAELDVYWAHAAGQDPADWLRRLAGRVPLAHFKDGIGGRHVPVGQGELDWKSILAAAETAGVEWAVVELDESPSDPMDCVAASLRHLEGLGLSL